MENHNYFVCWRQTHRGYKKYIKKKIRVYKMTKILTHLAKRGKYVIKNHYVLEINLKQ